jgi:hypothetical protein
MSLPPALTWLTLLPHEAHCFCATGPEWFRQLLADRADGTPPRRLAVWGKDWNDVNLELPKWDGVVAINCPHVTTARLEAAGYKYARRFAVLPSLEKARWFVSLDSGRAAMASFSVYTPSRTSAKIKKTVAQVLARLQVPGWYRDQVIVASREAPPIENKLAELFPGQEIRLALSSGAPEPAINRKPSAAVIDQHGRVLAFVKMSASKVSREIVEHEAEMLAALADLQRVRSNVPRLIFADEVDGRFVTVQSPLGGSPAPVTMTKSHEAFLISLRSQTRKPASETNMVATMGGRIDALQPVRRDLREIFDAFVPTLEQTVVPSTVVHGDFAPWNLRSHLGQMAAFDWEYGEIDGLPLVDQTHYALQLGYNMQQWTPEQAIRALGEMAAQRPLELDAEQVTAIHAVYLLDQLARLLGEGYAADHEMVSWYGRILRGLKTPTRSEAAAAEVAAA